MTAFFYKGLPDYRMRGFCPVRDAFDNLSNILHLAELINTCSHYRINRYEEDFSFAVFSGSFCRVLIRKEDGFFSMAIPFQIIDNGNDIIFNSDYVGESVGGRFISIMRSMINMMKNGNSYHDEIIKELSFEFDLDVIDASHYYDAFVNLLTDDHGYLRFDDDPANERADFHPRYHFDFFYKNTSSIKIGVNNFVDMNFFYELFDPVCKKRFFK